jgi:hypothetical protein
VPCGVVKSVAPFTDTEFEGLESRVGKLLLSHLGMPADSWGLASRFGAWRSLVFTADGSVIWKKVANARAGVIDQLKLRYVHWLCLNVRRC